MRMTKFAVAFTALLAASATAVMVPDNDGDRPSMAIPLLAASPPTGGKAVRGEDVVGPTTVRSAVAVAPAGNSCPEGYVKMTTPVGCAAAAAEVGLSDLGGLELAPEWPGGCYHCGDDVPNCDGVWFNHAAGSASGAAAPICAVPGWEDTVIPDAGDDCPEPCGEGSFCNGVAGCADCAESGIYHPQACGGLINDIGGKAVMACKAVCPDQTDALVTGVHCGGNYGPCGRAPGGTARFCDYQFGADAGGYCVECLWINFAPRPTEWNLMEIDAENNCVWDNCPAPCGEGNLCYRTECRSCTSFRFVHPSQCHQVTDLSEVFTRTCVESCAPATCIARADCAGDDYGVFFCNFADSDRIASGNERTGTCAPCAGLKAAEECGARGASSLGAQECAEVCETAIPTFCSTNEDCQGEDERSFCNHLSNACEWCPGTEYGTSPHCGFGALDGASLKNCDISCNTMCCNTTAAATDCYIGSLEDIDDDTTCERGCSDRLPCPSSPGAMYCDHYGDEYGTCQVCPLGEDERKEECFFSGLPLRAAHKCAETCQSTLAASTCKFCGGGISGSSLKSAPKGESTCDFCPDGLQRAYSERVIPFLGHDTTCYKMNQFFLSYRVAQDDPNCRLSVNFNYICGCEGPGYAGADSEAKKTALVWAPRISAILSFFSSFTIIVDVVRDPSRRAKVPGQLMATMSAFDLVGSVAYALTSLPIPTQYFILGSEGNDASCSAQGFFIQIGTTAAFINVSLAVYYYCVITLGWGEVKIQEIWRWLFVCPIVTGLIFACAGLPFYEMLFTWCNNGYPWWPEIPVIVAIILVTAIMATICWDVYKVRIFPLPDSCARIWYVATLPSPLLHQTEQNSAQHAIGATRTRDSMSYAVFVQGMWYLLSFYLTWPPYLALQYAWASGSGYSNYTFVIIACTMIPLQGFWNCVGYFRKRADKKMRKISERMISSWSQLMSGFRTAHHNDETPDNRPNGLEGSTVVSRTIRSNDATAQSRTRTGDLDPDSQTPLDQDAKGVSESA